MTYDRSTIDRLQSSVKEILDESAVILNQQFFRSHLEEMKVADMLLKPIYSRIESVVYELADTGSAITSISTDLSSLIDKTLIDIMKNHDFSELHPVLHKEKYDRLTEEAVKADRLRHLSEETIVGIELMMQDETLLDEDMLDENEPIRVSIRFNSESSDKDLNNYIDIDYSIDRETLAVTMI